VVDDARARAAAGQADAEGSGNRDEKQQAGGHAEHELGLDGRAA